MLKSKHANCAICTAWSSIATSSHKSSIEYSFKKKPFKITRRVKWVNTKKITNLQARIKLCVDSALIPIEEPDISIYLKTKKVYLKSERCHRPEWIKLRNKIKQLSEGMCGNCPEKGHAVHHILSVKDYPDLEYVESNLVLLCKACHRKRHPNLPEALFR